MILYSVKRHFWWVRRNGSSLLGMSAVLPALVAVAMRDRSAADRGLRTDGGLGSDRGCAEGSGGLRPEKDGERKSLQEFERMGAKPVMTWSGSPPLPIPKRVD